MPSILPQSSEWVPAVQELHRIVKPGGWVQLIEPDGELRCRNGESADIDDWNQRGESMDLAFF